MASYWAWAVSPGQASACLFRVTLRVREIVVPEWRIIDLAPVIGADRNQSCISRSLLQVVLQVFDPSVTPRCECSCAWSVIHDDFLGCLHLEDEFASEAGSVSGFAGELAHAMRIMIISRIRIARPIMVP